MINLAEKMLPAYPNNGGGGATELREEAGEVYDKAEAVLSKAMAAGRDLNSVEKADYDAFMSEANSITARIQQVEDAWKDEVSNRLGIGDNKPTQRRWIDRNGDRVLVLNKGERMTDHVKGYDPEQRVGNLVRAMVTGQRRFGELEIKAAQSESANSGGGFLVPEQLSSQLIDAARSRSVVMQAGAQTVAMDSETLKMAKVNTDPTFEVKTENAAFTGSDITFGQIEMTAYTIGTVVTSSKELAMDAPNFSEIVETTLSKALAAELDRLFLRGSGSQEPLGLINKTGVGSTASVAAITWEEVHTGAVDIRTNNHEPNAYIAHPTIAGDLDVLTTGDGANSAKNWLGPPPGVAELTRYQTTNLTTANVAIGDFTQALIGLRLRPEIAVSEDADNAFDKYQVKVRIVWRGDVNVEHANAFHILQGVTT